MRTRVRVPSLSPEDEHVVLTAGVAGAAGHCRLFPRFSTPLAKGVEWPDGGAGMGETRTRHN